MFCGPIRFTRSCLFSLWALICCILSLSVAQAKEIPGARSGNFDFYVLALSWSPSFCFDEQVALENRSQCGPGRRFAFIVHGLWPQYEGGDWPAFCPSQEPARVPDDLARSLLDIMPSFGLIGHQWRKHGVCSGLSQQAYFNLLRAAHARITIPPALRNLNRTVAVNPLNVEAAFAKFNEGLDAEEVAVSCGRNRLQEMRLCLTKDLQFRACPSVDLRGCKRGRVLMPPLR